MLGDECYGGKNKKGEEVYWDKGYNLLDRAGLVEKWHVIDILKDVKGYLLP